MNWLDFVVVGIFFISILAGLTRGVIKEVIALLTWVAAFFIACTFASQLAAFFSGTQAMQSVVSATSNTIGSDTSHQLSLLSLGVSFVILFVVTLIVGGIINAIVTGAASGFGIGIVNRLLGGVFGFARGYLIALVVLFVISISPLASQTWWQQSQFAKSFQPAMQWLGETIQPGFQTLKNSFGQTWQQMNQRVKGSIGSLYQGNGS